MQLNGGVRCYRVLNYKSSTYCKLFIIVIFAKKTLFSIAFAKVFFSNYWAKINADILKNSLAFNP